MPANDTRPTADEAILHWRHVHRLFHTLWTKAVGTKGYVKAEWGEMDRIIFRDAPPGFMRKAD